MSHIYEALERAERDRNNRPEPVLSEPEATNGSSDSSPATDVGGWSSIKRVKECTWKPNALFLPTLADHNPAIEQFRTLRSQLYQLRSQHDLTVIVVSSALPAEGKTFVATNLALSLARKSGDGVLLIDGDLRNPSIHKVLGTTEEPGLRQCLSQNVELFDAVQRNRASSDVHEQDHTPVSRLVFLPSGHGSAGALELGGNQRMEDLIGTARTCFSWVIVDTPPVLMAIDAVDIARMADGVLLVTRAGVTPLECAQKAKVAFANTRVLGVVLNAVKHLDKGSYYYYGHHNI
jgi:capsular exopolysaccharide synthesis family protein